MPDNKEISALTTAEQTSNNDLFETSIPNAMTDTGYISRKQSVTMLEQQMLGNTQYNTELPNFTAGNRTIFKALEEARSSGGGGASVIQKTMAEYTALPSADKMNGSIYKITDKALIYCLDEEYHAVLEITSADYAQLTSAEKNNGTLYIITDEETTADDIPYSAGVSVKDKIDGLAIDDLDDVSLTNPTNGDVLSYSSTGGSQGTGGWGNKALYPLFQISAEIQGSTVNIAANSWGDSIVSIPTVSGYRPIAFYKIYPNSPSNLCINSFDIESQGGTYTGRVRLRSFNSITMDANVRVSILYIRES